MSTETTAPERRDLWIRLGSWALGPGEAKAVVSVMEFAGQHPAVLSWARRPYNDCLGAGLPGTYGFELYLHDGSSRRVSVPACRCAGIVAAAFEGILP